LPNDTADELRAFLKLCLDPGAGREKRTPVRLLEILPPQMHDQLIRHAPHLRSLRHRVDALAEQQRAAHDEYADALAAWIRGDEPGPARRPLPLLEAVTLAYEAAVEHIDGCSTCRPDMRLAEMCPDGQRAAVAGLDTVPAAVTECAHQSPEDMRTVGGRILLTRCGDCGEGLPFTAVEMNAARADVAALDAEFPDDQCAHVAWEVTSEYRNARQMWVKSRKCADCGDVLEPLVEPEPHWPDKARQHPTESEPVRAYAPGAESEISTRGWTA